MKTFYTKLLSVAAAVVLLTSCEKDEVQTVLNPQATVVTSISAQNVVLLKEKAADTVLTISWARPDYGFSAAPAYTLLLDKKGGDFSKATAISVGSGLARKFRAGELNALLLNLGLTPGTAADVDVKVQSKLGERTYFTSAVNTFKVTPYLDALDLSTRWGIVGDATTNGWDGPDMPFYKTDKANVIVAYVTLKTGEIKIRQDNKWDVNYGDKGADGTLEAGADNIKVTAGTYRITFDTSALKYTIEQYALGLVGDATPNGWAGPDTPLTYDPTTDTWKATVALTAKEMKIRLNNDWAVNYGGASGALEAGGSNIKIAAAGTYLVTVDFKGMKYSVTAVK